MTDVKTVPVTTAEIVTKTVTQPVEVKMVQLTMTEDEANNLRQLLGMGISGKFCDNYLKGIYTALVKAGVYGNVGIKFRTIATTRDDYNQ